MEAEKKMGHRKVEYVFGALLVVTHPCPYHNTVRGVTLAKTPHVHKGSDPSLAEKIYLTNASIIHATSFVGALGKSPVFL